MPKLHQLLAVARTKKPDSQKQLTEIHRKSLAESLFEGLTKTYFPLDEENGERLPPEEKLPQYTARKAAGDARSALSGLYDLLASIDATNCKAKADVIIDGKTLLKDIPGTTLIYLEKAVVDLKTFISRLPVLDAAHRWQWDSSGYYRTEEIESKRLKKVFKNHVKYEATKEHPAQVETYTEDTPVGTWRTTKFSGGISAMTRDVLLNRIRKLDEALKLAREQANSIEAESVKVGDHLFDYLFADLTPAN